MTFFSKIFGAFTAQPSPHGPEGYRAFAVGDIHGRLDLLDQLLAKIEADIAGRPRAKNLIVFLGDLIDRGPQSAQVIERLRTWRPREVATIFLCGNHEEVLLSVFAGEPTILDDWLKFGGAECLASYDWPAAKLSDLGEPVALAAIKAAIPAEHQVFLESFSDTFRFGDYLFVHAGIRPGLDVAALAETNLRWIRRLFLDDKTDHGFVVVHGHTIKRSGRGTRQPRRHRHRGLSERRIDRYGNRRHAPLVPRHGGFRMGSWANQTATIAMVATDRRGEYARTKSTVFSMLG